MITRKLPTSENLGGRVPNPLLPPPMSPLSQTLSHKPLNHPTLAFHDQLTTHFLIPNQPKWPNKVVTCFSVAGIKTMPNLSCVQTNRVWKLPRFPADRVAARPPLIWSLQEERRPPSYMSRWGGWVTPNVRRCSLQICCKVWQSLKCNRVGADSS